MTQTEGTPSDAAPFGSVTAGAMVVCRTDGGVFGTPSVQPLAPLSLHPATHALHYGSSCFEGLKAHRGTDGIVRLFRVADHVARLQASADILCLPVPPTDLLADMIRSAVRANLDETPDPPGALYVRPVLLGTDPNIGAAATPSSEALLYIVASPVGDYFARGGTLTIEIETELPRSTPQFGRVKTGANYAMALGVTLRARERGADQVLFAPGGDVQETGASNFMLLDDRTVITKPVDGSFLAGVTRDSVLTLAGSLGYGVEERTLSVDEVLAWPGEAALTGTAATLAGVGAVIYRGETTAVGAPAPGPNTVRLRDALISIQRGLAGDPWGWTEPVSA